MHLNQHQVSFGFLSLDLTSGTLKMLRYQREHSQVAGLKQRHRFSCWMLAGSCWMLAASTGTMHNQGLRVHDKNSICKEMAPYGFAERKDFGGDHWAELYAQTMLCTSDLTELAGDACPPLPPLSSPPCRTVPIF